MQIEGHYILCSGWSVRGAPWKKGDAGELVAMYPLEEKGDGKEWQFHTMLEKHPETNWGITQSPRD